VDQGHEGRLKGVVDEFQVQILILGQNAFEDLPHGRVLDGDGSGDPMLLDVVVSMDNWYVRRATGEVGRLIIDIVELGPAGGTRVVLALMLVPLADKTRRVTKLSGLHLAKAGLLERLDVAGALKNLDEFCSLRLVVHPLSLCLLDFLWLVHVFIVGLFILGDRIVMVSTR
jgi:hypothetical protein